MTPPRPRPGGKYTAALAVLAVLFLTGCSTTPAPALTAARPVAPSAAPAVTPAPAIEPPRLPTGAEEAAPPRATYDAVIPGLIPIPGGQNIFPVAYRTDHDILLYGSPEARLPAAIMPATDFLGNPTTIVKIAHTRPGWTQILTPARFSLPSQSAGEDASTAAWIQNGQLAFDHALPYRIVIRISAQTLTISGPDQDAAYPVGVGAAATATPAGSTYLAARFTDPAQSALPINLLALHSTSADDPYLPGGNGVVGIHFERTATGAVSHGCIRLSRGGIDAVNGLPVGTPVEITP